MIEVREIDLLLAKSYLKDEKGFTEEKITKELNCWFDKDFSLKQVYGYLKVKFICLEVRKWKLNFEN